VTRPVDPSCVFCKIVAGAIPCFRLAEDARTLAFLDINPVHPGHALVVPKAHAPDLLESQDEDLGAAIAMARRVARAIATVLRPDGINLLRANGPGAAQSVRHLHLHVLPRGMNDGLPLNWTPVPGDKAQLAELAARLARVV
jgi:histidine triad (HIT) family protein